MTRHTHKLSRLLAAAMLIGFGLTSMNLIATGLSAQSKPCVSMNWTGTFRVQAAKASNFAIRASNGSNILAIDGVEFITRAISTAQTVTVSIWDSRGPMSSGERLATGTMSVSTTLKACKATFSTAAVIPANTNYWIEFNQGWNIYMPLVTTGTISTHYWSKGSGWSGPWFGQWRYRLHCKDVADVTFYGQGCLGGKPGCVATKSYNWSQTLASVTTPSKKVGIIDFAVSGTAPLCGFSVRSKARAKAVTLAVSTHDVTWSGSKPVPGTLLGSATLSVGTKAGDYTARFAKAFSPPASGMIMFVLDRADQIVLPTAIKGDAGFHVFFDGKAWSDLKFDLNWVYRLLRNPSATIPQLGATGRPILGKNFTILLSKARPSTGALFFLGASKTQWGSLPLPLDLKAIGAPGCFLLTSTEITLAVLTDAMGNSAVSLPVPNHASLVGKHFYNQFLIYDPGANSLNLVSSSAGDALVGRY